MSLETCADDTGVYAVAKPSPVVGFTNFNITLVTPIQFAYWSTDNVFPIVYVASGGRAFSCGSKREVLIVITVDDPGAASNFASILNCIN